MKRHEFTTIGKVNDAGKLVMYMQEIWKDVPGYEGIYAVSNLGEIKSLSHDVIRNNGRKYRVNERIKAQISNNGYKMVRLQKEGKGRLFMVHILVALAFIPNSENKPFIDHINTDRADNRVTNLRWVTRLENERNPLTMKKKRDHAKRMSKPVCKINGNDIIAKYESINEAARINEIQATAICHVCMGKRKSYKGFIWRYVYEK